MTLKACPGCNTIQTTKTVEKKGRDLIALYFNCKGCKSTFILRSKSWQNLIRNSEGKELDLVRSNLELVFPVKGRRT